MTEEGNGLEKYTSMFSRKLKEFRGRKSKEQFTRERALEKFRLLSAAGPEGQEPKATFRKGSTLVLSDQGRFPPGTILRETYDRTVEFSALRDENGEILPVARDTSGPYYLFYCLGDFNRESGNLTIFESAVLVDNKNNNTSPVYVLYEQPSPEKATTLVPHQINAGDKKAVEFTVGSGTTIHSETDFMKKVYTRQNGMFLANSIQVDVMMFGKKVKQEVKERKPAGLKQLIPQRTPSVA